MSGNGTQELAAHGIEYREGGWYKLPSGKRVRGRDRALRAVRARSSAANATEKLLRERFAQLAGLAYGADRDIWEVAGYPNEYTFAEGWSRYRRQDIVRRGVDLPVERTWRHPPIIREGEDDDTEFAQGWNDVWERLKLQSVFQRADRMASIGEYSVILLGFKGTATDAELRTPVESLDGPDDVLFAQPYKESNADVQTWVRDPSDPRFRKPETYRIDLGGDDPEVGAGSSTVHWSRVLHIVEDPLDSDVYGLPRLERVLNRLIDLEKIAAATGEAFWQIAVQTLMVSVDPEAGLSDTQWDALDDEMEELAHDLRRHFLGQGIDMKYLGGDSVDPTGSADLMMLLIAAAWGIPKRILFGSETGERASEQDERAFRAMVGDRQEQFAEPTMVRQLGDRLIMLGALPEPADGYDVEWPSLDESTDEEKSSADLNRAKTAKELTPLGGDPRDVAEVTEEGRVRLRPSEAEAA